MFAGFRKMPTFATAIEREATKQKLNGALVQLVRIHACHAWGHGFESRTHRESSDSLQNRFIASQGKNQGFKKRFIRYLE